MAEISAKLVKELREKTGAGMMDCKRALAASDGGMDAAVDWLRKKGLAAAAKRAGRTAAEGLIGVATRSGLGAMVEVNSETDFVARNEQFQTFVAHAAAAALTSNGELSHVLGARLAGSGETITDELTRLAATIGENLTLRRVVLVKAPVVANYVHGALRPGLGRIGVLVGLSGTSEEKAIAELGRMVGMHIAASRPAAINIDAVDPAALARERAVLTEQARASGKPEAIIAKMVEGRVRKYYEEVVLLEQVWVHDGESRVKAVLSKAGVGLSEFARFEVGEGVEKTAAD